MKIVAIENKRDAVFPVEHPGHKKLSIVEFPVKNEPPIELAYWSIAMTKRNLTLGTLTLSGLLALSGCSGMSHQQKDTAVGAGVGGVAGAVLSGGSVLGTGVGAVVGGVVGNEVGKK